MVTALWSIFLGICTLREYFLFSDDFLLLLPGICTQTSVLCTPDIGNKKKLLCLKVFLNTQIATSAFDPTLTQLAPPLLRQRAAFVRPPPPEVVFYVPASRGGSRPSPQSDRREPPLEEVLEVSGSHESQRRHRRRRITPVVKGFYHPPVGGSFQEVTHSRPRTSIFKMSCVRSWKVAGGSRRRRVTTDSKLDIKEDAKLEIQTANERKHRRRRGEGGRGGWRD